MSCQTRRGRTRSLSRMLALSVAGAIGLLGLTGCRGTEAETAETPKPIASDAAQKASPPHQPPVVVTTAKVLNDNDLGKLKPPDTIEDNPITRWAKQQLGVIQTYKWIVADEAALEKKVKLALGGDEELPDVLYLNDAVLPELLGELAASGKWMDVGEAFERYASPRLKQAYALNPGVWRTVKANGKLWGLPQISDGKVGDPILWIRRDWLDAVGLALPTTLAELETVLDAFTNGDPDGDGKPDTIGLALAGKHSLNAWLGDASFLFGAYGNQPYQWNRMPDGRLAYGSVQPEVKGALARLHEWYAKGWLHPNFATFDELAAVELFTSGAAGVISGPGWMGGWPLAEAAADRDGRKPVFQPLPYPAGEDGRVGRKGSKASYGSYMFRKDFAHMDLVFDYLDRVYGALIEDPASEFAHGFGENYDYRWQDGQAVYDFPGMTSTISNHLLIAPGSAPPGILTESLEQRVYRGKIETPYEKRLAAANSRLYLQGLITGDIQLANAQKDEFTGAPVPSMRTKWPALQKLEKEIFLKIVYGNEPPGRFDTFARDWAAYGGDVITREINDWDRQQ